MANSWYNRAKGFLAGTKARGSDVRFEYDAVEDAFDLMPAPHSGGSNTGFSGAVEFEGAVSLSGGLGSNASGASAYKLTNMIDGTADQDYATMANVAAEVSGGGTPGDIPITSLGVGTATASQFIKINSGGTAVVGSDIPDETKYYPGYMRGLELNSWDLSDLRHDMRLEVGSCMDSAGTELITLGASIEKQFDVAWVEGAGGGAGAVLPSSSGTGSYYFFLITKDTDGTVDFFGDTDSAGANKPSGWTIRRGLAIWPYLNVAGGAMGWVDDSGGRYQFGNIIRYGSADRRTNFLTDSTLVGGTAESVDMSLYMDNSLAGYWSLGMNMVSTNTSFQYIASMSSVQSNGAGNAHGCKTGIASPGDSVSDTNTVLIEHPADGTGLLWYVVSSGNFVSLLTIFIAIDYFYDYREENY